MIGMFKLGSAFILLVLSSKYLYYTLIKYDKDISAMFKLGSIFIRLLLSNKYLSHTLIKY